MTDVEEFRATVADLRVAIAELRITVAQITVRDVEDRGTAALFDGRISTLERWKARIQGQIALAYLLIGALATVIVGRISGVL